MCVVLLLEPVMNNLLATIQFPTSSADVSPAPSHRAPAEEVTQLMNCWHQSAVMADPGLSTQLGHQQTAPGEPDNVWNYHLHLCCRAVVLWPLPCQFLRQGPCWDPFSPGCWGSVPSWVCPRGFGAWCCWGSCPAAEAGMHFPLLWSME